MVPSKQATKLVASTPLKMNQKRDTEMPFRKGVGGVAVDAEDDEDTADPADRERARESGFASSAEMLIPRRPHELPKFGAF